MAEHEECAGCQALRKEVEDTRRRLDELTRSFNEHMHQLSGYNYTLQPREKYLISPGLPAGS